MHKLAAILALASALLSSSTGGTAAAMRLLGRQAEVVGQSPQVCQAHRCCHEHACAASRHAIQAAGGHCPHSVPEGRSLFDVFLPPAHLPACPVCPSGCACCVVLTWSLASPAICPAEADESVNWQTALRKNFYLSPTLSLAPPPPRAGVRA